MSGSNWRHGLSGALGLMLALYGGGFAHAARPYPVAEKHIDQLQPDMSAGRVTSEALVRAYLARIQKIDRSGPSLHSVIAVNPHALADARKLDAERKAGRLR